MIKRLLGVMVVLAVAAVIIISAIRRDNFKSMVLRDGIMNQEFPGPIVPEQYLRQDAGKAAPATVVDSVSISVTDSIG